MPGREECGGGGVRRERNEQREGRVKEREKCSEGDVEETVKFKP